MYNNNLAIVFVVNIFLAIIILVIMLTNTLCVNRWNGRNVETVTDGVSRFIDQNIWNSIMVRANID